MRHVPRDRRRPAVAHGGDRRDARRCRPPICAPAQHPVHGGIGFTWEHDAHLYLRRATALESIVDAEQAAEDVTDLYRRGRAPCRAPSTCRPRRSRSATRCASSSSRSRDLDADGAARGADRVRLRDAALAEAVGPRRRRGRAAGDRAGVRRRRHQASRVRHHRLGHPHAHPARAPRTRSRGGCRRR